MSKGSISLAMIAKDAEQTLARCLRSVQHCVNQIIVVDTGSQDATADIAKSYGALVVHHPWKNDFSFARNESLRYATGDWVLVLDADEELPPETALNLDKLAGTPGIDAWSFTIVSPLSAAEDSPKTEHLNIRMFRNNRAYRFEGKIHEQIKPSILRADAGAVIKYSNLKIMHYGYIGGTKERTDKTLRNISLLKETLLENPEDPFTNYNLGASYFALGDLRNSQRHFETALQRLDPNSGFAAALYRNYCVCLCEMGEYLRALELADKGLTYFPDYPDLYFIKGQIFWDLGMLPQAKASFLKCTRFRQMPPEYTTMQGVTSYLSFENLAEVYSREQNFAEAVKYVTLALKAQPSLRLLSKLCVLLRCLNSNGEEILTYLHDNFSLDPAVAARLLFDVEDFEASLSSAERVTSPGPELLLLKAKCLIRLGRYNEAIEQLRPIPADSPLAGEALKQKCIAAWLQEPRQDATAAIAAFPFPDNPAFLACKTINSLISANIERGTSNVERSPIQPEAVRQQALQIAIEAFRMGDKDLALAIGRAVGGGRGPGNGWFILGKEALHRGYNREAKKLLERALGGCAAQAEAFYLLGTACANLHLCKRAFDYFLNACRRSPGDELYALCALEQLAVLCSSLVLDGLNIEKGNPDLTRQLFTLTSLKRKLHRLKEAGSWRVQSAFV
ncbi:MAG: glycosyltransferase [Bacillota bacterium]